MIGPEGRGVPTIIEMVMMTRFDCIVGSASLMRQALAQALHHCLQREVSGRPLADHALMRNVLADLALESEAALLLAMRIARRLDEAPRDARARQFVRIATAVGKYWVCKRAPAHINEAAECLGGAGYVEESILPRLYREAPVNSTWEGSGNVQCVDVLRALAREPAALEAFLAELAPGAALDRRLAAHVARLRADLARGDDREHRARELVGRMALALQAALLLEAGPWHAGRCLLRQPSRRARHGVRGVAGRARLRHDHRTRPPATGLKPAAAVAGPHRCGHRPTEKAE